MSAPKKQPHVSLRGASAKEITRDLLLEKVLHERELRNYTRRAEAAALFIQRVWRRYYMTKELARQLQEEWETLILHHNSLMTCRWVSSNLLRPFLFFVSFASTRHQRLQTKNVECMLACFKILLQSINSADPKENFCFLAVGTPEERRTWLCQSQKLVSICSFILAECEKTCSAGRDKLLLTSLAMQLVVALTDPKGWKIINNVNLRDAHIAVKNLIQFITIGKNGIYSCIRSYFMRVDVQISSQGLGVQTDDHLLITASAITLALRPFHLMRLDISDVGPLEVKEAVEQYCTHFLTVPWLAKRLPAVLLPALKHESVLSPSLKILMISKEKIFCDMSKLGPSGVPGYSSELIPCAGWALANIINLAAEYDNDSGLPGHFVRGLDCGVYVLAVTTLSENLMQWLANIRQMQENDEVPCDESTETVDLDNSLGDAAFGSFRTSYIELLKPLHQQWHLMKLLAVVNKDVLSKEADIFLANQKLESSEKLGFVDIAVFYSCILQIFSSLNPLGGSLPILNTLSFTPGFLVELWGVLESTLFSKIGHFAEGTRANVISGSQDVTVLEKKRGRVMKDAGSKWVSVLQKISGKSSSTEVDCSHAMDPPRHPVNDDAYDYWDVEPLRHGPEGISKDVARLLHLFCATYAHLLLVLDDIEFYEKQDVLFKVRKDGTAQLCRTYLHSLPGYWLMSLVPFVLEQQRRIVSMLNTLLYNCFSCNNGQHKGQSSKPLMDAAVRCLHLLYERDCRHRFCPPPLWLAPARKNRLPIAVAARAHEAVSTNVRFGNTLTNPCLGSVITAIPHVFPFEERVQMFREFIKMDKVSRRMAGEVGGLCPGSIEIVIRRDHIVEDGFRQLNSLGSRLKSGINVSFVSECGLPEAGLDYGGLSKEFLTDISRKAFDPEYGLFTQTSNSERLLIPNVTAKLVENGIQMIEFLGRVVGKALYEGILLDYSFSLVFVQKLLGRYSFLDELSTLDPELYRNLIYVKHFDGDVKELSLDFTVTEELFGQRVVTELKPGGKNVAVTTENCLQYIYAIADYKLNRQILPFANAFYRGLIDLISPSWLSLFNASEFNQLLSGGEHDIDVLDLRNNTQYTGGYSEGSRTIKLFWEVITGFEPKERCMLLKFVTSCSRAPLLGFKHLQPTFTIHKVACDVPLLAMIGGQDVDRLPSASTCYNTLKLPTYKRASTLRSKLLYAINSNAGFELS